uniref:NADH dehydrogenase subunit 6 n=1 Tax=Falcidens acutargatus TaxID=2079778 RepID=A0A343X867_9MOLL|nr:NADH dehydrogenase subunit 6 [Falcidens acutargatus]AWH02126.1 NADH dehydrogenase subunit 6 [Falcidens acutargatus]
MSVVLLSVLAVLVLLFPLMLHPLSMGVMLMLAATTLSLLMGSLFSGWVGMVMFLIYVGGLLVMFVFVITFLSSATLTSISFLGGFISMIYLSLFIPDGSTLSLLVEKNSVPFSKMLMESSSTSMYVGAVSILFVLLSVVSYLSADPMKSLRGQQIYVYTWAKSSSCF